MKQTMITKLKLALIALILVSAACSKDDGDGQGPVDESQLRGKWKVTAMDGKLFVKVGDIPETEAPLLAFWQGKTFYFQDNGRLAILDNQAEVFDFGAYTLTENKLTVANYPGILQVALPGSATMELTNKQDDYYKMMAFYSGQSESEIRQLYRVEGDIVFRLTKQ